MRSRKTISILAAAVCLGAAWGAWRYLAPPAVPQLAAGRRLRDPARSTLVAALARYPDRVVGIYAPAVPEENDRRERAQLAQDLAAAFAKAGWRGASHETGRLRADYPGIVFAAYEGNQPPANPDFAPLREAFDRAGIPYREMRLREPELFVDPISTADPVIYIGSP